ncbi:MAG TPA: hypothetical protein VKT49_01450 [Bryobacteraceae bacterium]|nr:hypothetical protein [Bryobacteraceae bacterium]
MLSIILTLCSGRLKEGVLLAMNQDSMRVVLRGDGDARELRRVEGRWRGENNDAVDFEVLLTDGHGEIDLWEAARPRTMAAGCA